MEEILIEIPDNITPIQEYNLIVKNLSKNLLPSGLKLIGNGYTLKQLNTRISIKRVPTEDCIITSECSVCGTIHEIKYAYKLKTNYGGKNKINHYCSGKCRELVYNVCGEGRAKKVRRRI